MQRDQWAFPQLAREATRNVFDLRSRLFPLVILAILIGVAIPLYTAVQSQQFLHQLDKEAAQGRNLVVLSALDKNAPAHITRASCEGLVRDGDVQRAGIVVPQSTDNFLQLGTEVPVVAASSTLLPDLDQYGAVVGKALRARGPAFTLRMPNAALQRAVVGTGQPDVIGTNSDVTVGLPPQVQASSSCIVVLDQFAKESTVARRILAEVNSTGGALTAEQQFTEPQNPITAYLQRPEQYLPLLLGLFGALAAATINRLRTGEWAAYRMSGTSPRSLYVVLVLEQALIAGCLSGAGILTSVVIGARTLSPESAAASTLAAAALWVIATALGGADIPLRKPTDLAKDR